MEIPEQRPETIDRLANAVPAGLAMLAGMQLDLFTLLEDGPIAPLQIAEALGVGLLRLKPLLYSLAAAGLLTAEGDLFSNTPETSNFLVQGTPAYLGWKHRPFLHQWSGLLKTSESVRTGSPQSRQDFSEMSGQELETFARRSYPRALTAGRDLVTRFDFSAKHNLLDVGGGTGGLAIAVTEACPHLKGAIVDQANITPMTRRLVAEADATSRVQVITADVVKEPLAGSYDVAVLCNFIQALGPEQARRALWNVGQAVGPGGTAIILGSGILDDSHLSPPEAVTFNLVAINVLDVGGSYTEQEHKLWLAEAGFAEDFERQILPDGSGIIKANKPV